MLLDKKQVTVNENWLLEEINRFIGIKMMKKYLGEGSGDSGRNLRLSLYS